MRLFTFILITSITLMGCNNDGPDGEDLITSNQYFPLAVGKYVDYAVTEVIYRDEGASVDTLSYFLREETVSSRQNSNAETEYIIDRSTKNTATSSWIYQESWRALFSENQVLRIEDNLTFVKLKLPISPEETWDGNSFFDPLGPISIGGELIEYYKGWSSSYSSVGTSAMIESRNFNDVIVLTLADTENRIEIRKAQETYASGIGLISKQIRVLNTQCFDTCVNTPWEEKAESGHIFVQHLIDHN